MLFSIINTIINTLSINSIVNIKITNSLRIYTFWHALVSFARPARACGGLASVKLCALSLSHTLCVRAHTSSIRLVLTACLALCLFAFATPVRHSVVNRPSKGEVLHNLLRACVKIYEKNVHVAALTFDNQHQHRLLVDCHSPVFCFFVLFLIVKQLQSSFTVCLIRFCSPSGLVAVIERFWLLNSVVVLLLV